MMHNNLWTFVKHIKEVLIQILGHQLNLKTYFIYFKKFKIVKKFIKNQQDKKQQDSFQQYQASNESPKKDNPFDNFSSFAQITPKVQQKKPTFQLNLVDLDFLDAMGMSTSKQVKKPQSNPNPSKVQKPQTVPLNKKNPNEQLMKKLQNQDFISVFNNKHTSQSQKTQIQKYNSNQNQNIKIQQIKPKQKIIQAPVTPKIPIIITKSDKQLPPSQSFVQQLKCKQINKNKIQQNLICTITDHEIMNPNIFVPKFVLYTITSTPNNISVKRRMKDFQQLRSLLQKMFPTTQIPHLQRYSRLSQTQPHVISKQKLYLQSFLNSLLMNPLLRCKILEDFLFCTDLQLIKKIFREWQKIQKPKSLQQLWTATGKVKLDTNTANRRYINQQLLYIDYVQNSFAKLKSLYDQLMTYYQNTSKIISDIAEVYDQLKQTTKTVNDQFLENLRFKTFEPVISAVSHIHKQMSDSLQTQAKIINNQLKHIFKYEGQNFQTIKQTLKNLSNIYESYQKRNDKESARKQAYDSRKLAQYKTGVEIPSKNITVLKYQSAYAQNQFRDQICRYMSELAKKVGAKFQIFSTLQVSIGGDMDLVWRDFQQFIQKK